MGLGKKTLTKVMMNDKIVAKWALSPQERYG